MIEPMAKVRLACPRSLLERVTALLQEAGVLHIESAPSEAARIPLRPQVMDEPARQRQAELERLREELRRVLLLLPDVPPPSSADGQRATEDWRRIASWAGFCALAKSSSLVSMLPSRFGPLLLSSCL